MLGLHELFSMLVRSCTADQDIESKVSASFGRFILSQ